MLHNSIIGKPWACMAGLLVAVLSGMSNDWSMKITILQIYKHYTSIMKLTNLHGMTFSIIQANIKNTIITP